MTSPAATAGYVAIGLASAAGEAVTGVAGRTARLVRRSPMAAVARGTARIVATSRVGPRLGAMVDELSERGRREAEVRLPDARRLLDQVVDTVAVSEPVVRMVNDVVEEVIWPVVDEVLPAVLEKLSADPKPVQALVRGQSTGMIEDVTSAVRARAVQADDRAASVVDRLLHRVRTREPASTSVSAPAPAPASAPAADPVPPLAAPVP